MGALLVLNLADNELGKLAPPEEWSYGYHGDYSGNEYYKHTDGREIKSGTPEGTISGAIIMTDTIKDMRALSSINLLKNKIPVEQAQELVKIMQAKENLTTLCGLSREETELNFSGQGLEAGDAVLIANDIGDMGTIACLIGDNRFEAKKTFFKATLTCKHCGQHKDQHRKVYIRSTYVACIALPEILMFSVVSVRQGGIIAFQYQR
jgi:hypothetical protein